MQHLKPRMKSWNSLFSFYVTFFIVLTSMMESMTSFYILRNQNSKFSNMKTGSFTPKRSRLQPLVFSSEGLDNRDTDKKKPTLTINSFKSMTKIIKQIMAI